MLYLSLVVTALLATGPDFLAHSAAPLADLYRAVADGEPRVIAAIGLLAIINGALIQIIMAARILYGLASREHLPKVLSSVNPRTRTPLAATVLASAAVLTLALIGRLAVLAETTSLIILMLFAGVNYSLWRIERRMSGALPPVAYVALTGTVICLAMVGHTLYAWLVR